jgi:hypothetical protein
MARRWWWHAGFLVIDGVARMGIVRMVLAFLRALMVGRAELAAENVALRHQLAVLQRSIKRPRLRKRDRVFWVWLSRLWPAST